MSENKNLNVVEDAEVKEVPAEEKESKFEKAKAGIKKHGKTIGMVVGAVTLGLIGYALGKKSSSCGNDYDDIIDTDGYIVDDDNPTE